jgi:GSH-dependent disulfide-bond oxidoreductase
MSVFCGVLRISAGQSRLARMIELFFFPSPNGLKVAIALEECGLSYRVTPVDISKGEQFAPGFLAISPNNKIPAIIDHETGLSLFESGVILEYLAEKSGRFLPETGPERWRVKQWLMWQMAGLGPMAGQAHHFRAFAPEAVPYAIARYTNEVNRLYGVLERQLALQEYVCGAVSIADFAILPWILPHERQGQDLAEFPNLSGWLARMLARQGVIAGLKHRAERLLSREEYKLLLGQTAQTVAQQSAKRT